jgi:hypothetical protein
MELENTGVALQKALLVLGLTAACWLLSGTETVRGAQAAQDTVSLERHDKHETEQLRFLGSPYVAANSDVGFTIGLGASFNRGSDVNLTLSTSYSTRGFMSLSLRGEVVTGEVRWIREIIASRYKRELYQGAGWSPEAFASATTDRLQLTLAPLWKVQGVEVGPEVNLVMANSYDSEFTSGYEYWAPARFKRGLVATGGVRYRRRTMSATRPMSGWLLDGAVRVGVADGEMLIEPQPEVAIDAQAATALKISGPLRLYLRGQYIYSKEAPDPVQPFLGGIQTLRGQPLERDYGRRILMSRSQLHYRFAHNWAWPGQLANRLIPIIPPLRLDLELVAFHDMGMVGSLSSVPWYMPRQGFGGGIRWVVPPELVFFFDIASAPDGTLYFYFGGGETL